MSTHPLFPAPTADFRRVRKTGTLCLFVCLFMDGGFGRLVVCVVDSVDPPPPWSRKSGHAQSVQPRRAPAGRGGMAL